MKIRFALITLFALAGCLDSTTPSDEPNVSTLEQGVQSCTASCDPPTYNGVAVTCTSNIVCVSVTEGVGCLNDDQTTVTTNYCSPILCGDGVCTRPYEDVQSCPADCGCPAGTADCCGDGLCHSFAFCSKNLC